MGWRPAEKTSTCFFYIVPRFLWVGRPAVLQYVAQGCQIFLVQNTKTGKITKLPRTVPNVHKILQKTVSKMNQVSVKYTNIFHCKTPQNLPKLGFYVWKQTIWQPWCSFECLYCAAKHSLRDFSSSEASVTGWVREKIAQNVAQPIVVKNKTCVNLYLRKSSTKMWASSEIFKTLPKANNGPLGEKTKIRRIWSRCRRRNLQGCQMACFQTKNPKFGQILEGLW
jgi:hypothetical protein